jgi:hypothetical protein
MTAITLRQLRVLFSEVGLTFSETQIQLISEELCSPGKSTIDVYVLMDWIWKFDNSSETKQKVLLFFSDVSDPQP